MIICYCQYCYVVTAMTTAIDIRIAYVWKCLISGKMSWIHGVGALASDCQWLVRMRKVITLIRKCCFVSFLGEKLQVIYIFCAPRELKFACMHT